MPESLSQVPMLADDPRHSIIDDEKKYKKASESFASLFAIVRNNPDKAGIFSSVRKAILAENVTDPTVLSSLYLESKDVSSLLSAEAELEILCRETFLPWLQQLYTQSVRHIDGKQTIVLNPNIIQSELTYIFTRVLFSDLHASIAWMQSTLAPEEVNQATLLLYTLGGLYGEFDPPQDVNRKKRAQLHAYVSTTSEALPFFSSFLQDCPPDELETIHRSDAPVSQPEQELIESLIQYNATNQDHFFSIALQNLQNGTFQRAMSSNRAIALQASRVTTGSVRIDRGTQVSTPVPESDVDPDFDEMMHDEMEHTMSLLQASKQQRGLEQGRLSQGKKNISSSTLFPHWARYSGLVYDVDPLNLTPGSVKNVTALMEKFSTLGSDRKVFEAVFLRWKASQKDFASLRLLFENVFNTHEAFRTIYTQQLEQIRQSGRCSEETFLSLSLYTIINAYITRHSEDSSKIQLCQEMLAICIEKLRTVSQEKFSSHFPVITSQQQQAIKSERSQVSAVALDRLGLQERRVGLVSTQHPSYLEYISGQETEAARLLGTTREQIKNYLLGLALGPKAEGAIRIFIELVISYAVSSQVVPSQIEAVGASLIVTSISEILLTALKGSSEREKVRLLAALSGVSQILSQNYTEIAGKLETLKKTSKKKTSAFLLAGLLLSIGTVAIHNQNEQRSQVMAPESTIAYAPSINLIPLSATNSGDQSSGELRSRSEFSFSERAPEAGFANFDSFINPQMQPYVRFWSRSVSEISQDGGIEEINYGIERNHVLTAGAIQSVQTPQEFQQAINLAVQDNLLVASNRDSYDGFYAIPVGWEPVGIIRMGEGEGQLVGYWHAMTGLRLQGDFGIKTAIVYRYSGVADRLANVDVPLPMTHTLRAPDGYGTIQAYFAEHGNTFGETLTENIASMQAEGSSGYAIAWYIYNSMRSGGYDYGFTQQPPPSGSAPEILDQLFSVDAQGNPIYAQMVCRNFAYTQATTIEITTGIQVYLLSGTMDAGRPGGQGYSSRSHQIITVAVNGEYFAFDATLPDTDGNLNYPALPAVDMFDFEALSDTGAQFQNTTSQGPETSSQSQESQNSATTQTGNENPIKLLLAGIGAVVGGAGIYRYMRKRRGEHVVVDPHKEKLIAPIANEVLSTVPRAVDAVSLLLSALLEDMKLEKTIAGNNSNSVESHVKRMVNKLLDPRGEELPFSPGYPSVVLREKVQRQARIENYIQNLGTSSVESLMHANEDLQHASLAFLENTLPAFLPEKKRIVATFQRLHRNTQKEFLAILSQRVIPEVKHQLGIVLGEINPNKIYNDTQTETLQRRLVVEAFLQVLQTYERSLRESIKQ